MKREIFSQDVTGGQFFTIDGLQKLTGCYEFDFSKVIIKELIDNALDEVESQDHGIIVISVQKDIFQIWDNGRGMSPKLVNQLLDRQYRVSGKKQYISPTRGKQGNALKTVFGIPCAMGINGDQVIIESQGLKHIISHKVDPDGSVVSNYETKESEVTNGTLITVFGGKLNFNNQLDFINSIISFNPHISFSAKNEKLDFKTIQGCFNEIIQNQKKCTKEFTKYRINDEVDIHWFTFNDFHSLAWHYLKYYPDTKLRLSSNADKDNSFLQIFSKLTNYRSQNKCIPISLKEYKTMGDFPTLTPDVTEKLLKDLYYGLINNIKPLPIKNLGFIGKDNFKLIFPNIDHSESYYLNKSQDFFLIEIFIVKSDNVQNSLDTTKINNLNFGVNFSVSYESFFPSYDSDFSEIRTTIEKLREKHFCYFHIISPNLQYSDYSKNRLIFGKDQIKLLNTIFKKIHKDLLAKDEKSIKQEKEKQILNRKNHFLPIKDAISNIAQSIYDKQSENSQFVLTMRNYFYAIRDHLKKTYPDDYYNITKGLKISQWGDQDNDYSYFRNVIYDLLDNDIINAPNLIADARGILYEPHQKIEIQLGTKQVDDYVVSDKEYQGILYIEKENPIKQLNQAKIGEKYDILLCASKGYAVRAVKTLLKKCQRKNNFKIFCIHDADPDGYMIYQDLVNKLPETEIIDLGLKIEEGINMGITPENFTRKKAIPSDLRLNENEKSLFEQKLRIEISVMSPREFINWVDDKLSQYLPSKKLPDQETLTDEIKPSLTYEIENIINLEIPCLTSKVKNIALKDLNQEIETALIPIVKQETEIRKQKEKILAPFQIRENEILESLNINQIESLKDTLPEILLEKCLQTDYISYLENKLKDDPYQSWLNISDDVVNDSLKEKKPEILNEIKQRIIDITKVDINP